MGYAKPKNGAAIFRFGITYTEREFGIRKRTKKGRNR